MLYFAIYCILYTIHLYYILYAVYNILYTLCSLLYTGYSAILKSQRSPLCGVSLRSGSYDGGSTICTCRFQVPTWIIPQTVHLGTGLRSTRASVSNQRGTQAREDRCQIHALPDPRTSPSHHKVARSSQMNSVFSPEKRGPNL